MFRGIIFFCLITAAFASETLNVIGNASAGFLAAILQQLAAVQSDPSPTEFAEKTIDYAEAKTAYFMALRAAVQVHQYSDWLSHWCHYVGLWWWW
jgi:hypothetical protein